MSKAIKIAAIETTIKAPANLLEIVEIIGEGAALQLVTRFGGTTVRLPALRNITRDHALAQCIGADVLMMLIKEIGGGRWLYVPMCKRGLIEQRNREIVERYSDGEKVYSIARHFRISDRQVWNILGSTVVDERQQGLF